MSFTVTVDAQRWRDHQRAVVDAVQRASGSVPVPVIKGNGYGLGATVLGAEAMRWDADTIAVGTIFEVDEVAVGTRGDIVVLEPFQPADSVAAEAWWRLGEKLHAGRVIRTVASIDALRALAPGPGSVRVILEANTSMHRFGFAEPPHQHVSMIWLPHECVVPEVGDRLAADVRFTTSRFDAVLGL